MSRYLDRYRPTTPDQHVLQAVRALGYFDDVDDDRQLPVPRKAIEMYWARRRPEIARRLGR